MSERKYFGKLREGAEPPNLIEIQLNSYVEFLQTDVALAKRKETGLQAVFKEVFPITSYDEKVTLDFASYEIGEPKLSIREAMREGQTFSAPLHVTFLLKEEHGTKEEKVYMGEIPLMTPQGTFVINGAERVVVSQFAPFAGHFASRAPCTHGKVLFSFRIIPDPRIVGGSSIRHQTIFFTSISTAGSAAANFSPPPSCARWATARTKRLSNSSTRSKSFKLTENLEEEEIATKVLIADGPRWRNHGGALVRTLTKATIRQILTLGVWQEEFSCQDARK